MTQNSSVASPLGLTPKSKAAKALMNERYCSLIPVAVAIAGGARTQLLVGREAILVATTSLL